MTLSGQVALVTGASRGIGKGIALQLGKAGATVYVTGRKPADSDSTKLDHQLPTLEKTAQEVTMRGGKGIAVYCDHSNMDEVKALFEQIERENDGRLDILVNNAYSAVNTIFEGTGTKFYEQPVEVWDQVNIVGLKNHYYCSWYAARLMVKHKKGLIVNVSSFGGLKYLFNIPYGVGKEALDRMSADMGVELKDQNVTVISLWPGAVRTELITGLTQSGAGSESTKKLFADGETIEYPGLAVAHFATDRERHSFTGRTLLTSDLGHRYGFADIDGRHPPCIRSINGILARSGYQTLAGWIPEWVKLPGWVLWTSSSRL